jgi:hypothetical protein
MTYPIATLADIVAAANTAEGRFDPKSCHQVSDVRVACLMDDGTRWYVVSGKTFRQVSAFAWHYAVEVSKDGINCHSETSPENAEAACFLLMDARRAEVSK